MPHRKLVQEVRARFALNRKAHEDSIRTPMPTDDEPDLETVERVQRLEARVAHLEAALEGLQDSVYRESRRLDDAIAELQRKTEPENLARALSADARRRGI